MKKTDQLLGFISSLMYFQKLTTQVSSKRIIPKYISKINIYINQSLLLRIHIKFSTTTNYYHYKIACIQK